MQQLVPGETPSQAMGKGSYKDKNKHDSQAGFAEQIGHFPMRNGRQSGLKKIIWIITWYSNKHQCIYLMFSSGKDIRSDSECFFHNYWPGF